MHASAADFLEWSGKFRVPADGRCLPKFDDEIIREIVKGRPLLCLVKDCTWEGDEPDLECEDGHWGVICGYLQTRSGNKLLNLDPDPYAPNLISISYDDKTYFYRDRMYFQSTTYLDVR